MIKEEINIYQLSDNSSRRAFQSVSELHQTQLSAGILAELSISALSKFYRFVALNEQHSVLIIATKGNEVCGFVCGTLDLHRLYIQFIKTHPITVITSLLLLTTKPKLYKRIGSLVTYIRKPRLNGVSVKAELLSMAVSPSKTRSGIGRRLLGALTDYFRSHDVQCFKVVSSYTQKEAHDFYQSLGGKQVGQLEIGLLKSMQYVFNIVQVDHRENRVD